MFINELNKKLFALYELINTSKSNFDFTISNIAFLELLELQVLFPKEIILEYDSSNNTLEDILETINSNSFDNFNYYYDCLVVRYKELVTKIPIPLLKNKYRVFLNDYFAKNKDLIIPYERVYKRIVEKNKTLTREYLVKLNKIIPKKKQQYLLDKYYCLTPALDEKHNEIDSDKIDDLILGLTYDVCLSITDVDYMPTYYKLEYEGNSWKVLSENLRRDGEEYILPVSKRYLLPYEKIEIYISQKYNPAGAGYYLSKNPNDYNLYPEKMIKEELKSNDDFIAFFNTPMMK